MPVKSFIGEIEDAARRFYATMIAGEVSDANMRGYPRAASQIEEIWQEIDTQVKGALDAGTPPWEAYAARRYPLAYIRMARTYQVFVRELLAADTAANPATAGYLPRVMYDQANALCHSIQPNIEHAVAALHDATFVPDRALPVDLGPRIEADGACPLPHLEGMLAAAREVRVWAAGLIAEYQHAIDTVTSAAPAAVMTHLQSLQAALAQADSALRFGTDLVGQVSQVGATEERHEQAENSLWESLAGYFVLNQVIASAELSSVRGGGQPSWAPRAGTATDVSGPAHPAERSLARRRAERPQRAARHGIWHQ